MTTDQRAVLETMARSRSLPHRNVVQARALLLSADGVPTNEVARRCATSDTSVRAWRRRFEAEGVVGVGRIAPGRGRKPWAASGHGVPRHLEVHAILDNFCAHMGPEVTTWLTHPKPARWRLHFIPLPNLSARESRHCSPSKSLGAPPTWRSGSRACWCCAAL
jgi:hypothetical protein